MKQQINFRASDLTTRQLDELSSWWGASQTETVTVAIDRIHRQEQAKRMEAVLEDILSGKISPVNSPTTGETFFYKNEEMPLLDIGRVPGATGRHVLRKPDGSLTTVGGYYLRRDGEQWSEIE